MVRITIVLLGVCMACLASAKPVQDYDWLEVRTENFLIYSLLSERQTLSTARYFEALRPAIPPNLLPWNKDRPVPDTVFLLKGTEQIRELGYPHDTWYLSDSSNLDFIVIGADVNSHRAVASAYLRFLIGGKSTREHVLWYEEGLVYLFRDAEIDNDQFLFGNFRGSRALAADDRQRALDRLFSGMDHTRLSGQRHRTLFWDSWVLVRLLIEGDGWQTFGDKLRIYVEQVDRGVDARQAFESVFRIPFDQLGRRATEFVVERCCNKYGHELSSLLPTFEYEVSEPDRAKVSLALAGVAASLDAHDKARELFGVAQASDSTRAAANAGLEALEQKNAGKKCPDCAKNTFDGPDDNAVEKDK
jgi:hypothetical protein